MNKFAYILTLALSTAIISSPNCYAEEYTFEGCHIEEYKGEIDCYPQEYTKDMLHCVEKKGSSTLCVEEGGIIHQKDVDRTCYDKATSQPINGVLKRCIGSEYFESCYKNGRLNGLSRIYKKGLLNSEYNYKNGQRHGFSKGISPTGLIHTAAEFNNGRLIGERSYYTSGALGEDVKYDNCKKLSEKFYDEHGNPIDKKEFIKLYREQHENKGYVYF